MHARAMPVESATVLRNGSEGSTAKRCAPRTLVSIRADSQTPDASSGSLTYGVQTPALAAKTAVSILRGGDPPIDRASEELGHRLRLMQTGLVLWLDDEPQEASPILEGLAQSIAKTLGAQRALALPVGGREMWAWLATYDSPSFGAVESLAEGRNARVAIGSPQPGLDGFRRSHREAVNAQRLVTTRRATSRLTRYEEVELVCLMSTDLDGVGRLIDRELGGLAIREEALEYLRETLASYLRNGCSNTATAEELYVHRNTVLWRLQRIAELVGHPLTERRTEMDLALRLLEWQ